MEVHGSMFFPGQVGCRVAEAPVMLSTGTDRT